MHFSNSIASFTGFVGIFASVSADPTSAVGTKVTKLLTKRVCGSGCEYCTYKNNFLFNSWGIYLPDDKAIDEECGRGILDNIQGFCGSRPTNWQCYYDDDGVGLGAWMYFNTPQGCLEPSIELALRAAGSAKNMYQDTVCGPEP